MLHMIDLLRQCLQVDPFERPSAAQLLQHAVFRTKRKPPRTSVFVYKLSALGETALLVVVQMSLRTLKHKHPPQNAHVRFVCVLLLVTPRV